jgi:hypothetical protein
MAYKAVSRIKTGDDKSDVEYIERGETVKKGDFSDEEWDDLVAAKAVMEDKDYALAFPEVTGARNQASGTPSNLEQVEGTSLQVNPPPEGPAEEEPTTLNPADPPKVDDANGDLVGTGSAKGFDTKGATNKTKAENVKGVEGPPGDAGPK